MFAQVLDKNEPIRITFGFTLKQMVHVDVEDQSISLKIWLRSYWVNQLMRWDPNDYNNVSSVQLREEEVWTPNLVPLEKLHQGARFFISNVFFQAQCCLVKFKIPKNWPYPT